MTAMSLLRLVQPFLSFSLWQLRPVRLILSSHLWQICASRTTLFLLTFTTDACLLRLVQLFLFFYLYDSYVLAASRTAYSIFTFMTATCLLRLVQPILFSLYDSYVLAASRTAYSIFTFMTATCLLRLVQPILFSLYDSYVLAASRTAYSIFTFMTATCLLRLIQPILFFPLWQLRACCVSYSLFYFNLYDSYVLAASRTAYSIFPFMSATCLLRLVQPILFSPLWQLRACCASYSLFYFSLYDSYVLAASCTAYSIFTFMTATCLLRLVQPILFSLYDSYVLAASRTAYSIFTFMRATCLLRLVQPILFSPLWQLRACCASYSLFYFHLYDSYVLAASRTAYSIFTFMRATCLLRLVQPILFSPLWQLRACCVSYSLFYFNLYDSYVLAASRTAYSIFPFMSATCLLRLVQPILFSPLWQLRACCASYSLFYFSLYDSYVLAASCTAYSIFTFMTAKCLLRLIQPILFSPLWQLSACCVSYSLFYFYFYDSYVLAAPRTAYSIFTFMTATCLLRLVQPILFFPLCQLRACCVSYSLFYFHLYDSYVLAAPRTAYSIFPFMTATCLLRLVQPILFSPLWQLRACCVSYSLFYFNLYDSYVLAASRTAYSIFPFMSATCLLRLVQPILFSPLWQLRACCASYSLFYFSLYDSYVLAASCTAYSIFTFMTAKCLLRLVQPILFLLLWQLRACCASYSLFYFYFYDSYVLAASRTAYSIFTFMTATCLLRLIQPILFFPLWQLRACCVSYSLFYFSLYDSYVLAASRTAYSIFTFMTATCLLRLVQPFLF